MKNFIFPLTLKKVLLWLLSIIVFASIFHAPTRWVVYDLTGRLLSPEQLAARNKNDILKKRARDQGVSLREYKKRQAAGVARRALNKSIDQAIADADLTSLDRLLSQVTKKQDVSDDIYRKAIKSNVLGSLKVIHQHGYNCTPIRIDERQDDGWYYDTKTEQAAYLEINQSGSPELVAEWVS